MSADTAAAVLAGTAAAELDRQVPTIVAPTTRHDEAVVAAQAVRQVLDDAFAVVVQTAPPNGPERTRRALFLTLAGAEAAVDRARARGHRASAVVVRLVPLLALLTLAAATPDPSVRRAFAVLVRSPRSAFVDVLVTQAAANRRGRIATNRGWSARVAAVDVVAVDGLSIDPRDLDEPAPIETTPPVRRTRRRSRRSTHARLDRAETAAAAGEVVDLADHDEVP